MEGCSQSFRVQAWKGCSLSLRVPWPCVLQGRLGDVVHLCAQVGEEQFAEHQCCLHYKE